MWHVLPLVSEATHCTIMWAITYTSHHLGGLSCREAKAGFWLTTRGHICTRHGNFRWVVYCRWCLLNGSIVMLCCQRRGWQCAWLMLCNLLLENARVVLANIVGPQYVAGLPCQGVLDL